MSLPRFEGWEPPHLSYSTINGYRTCGKRLLLEKVYRVESIPLLAGMGGNAVHVASEKVDELILAHGLDSDELDMLRTDELFAECWAAELADRKKRAPSFDLEDYIATGRASAAYGGKKNEQWWLDNGPGMIDNWIKWRRESAWEIWETPEGVPAVEVEINFQLPDGTPIKTFIDRIMVTPVGEPAVVDLKSGRLPETAEQLGLYRCAIWAKYDLLIDWGYFWDAPKGVHVGPYDLGRYTPDYFVSEANDVVLGMNAGSYPAKPANGCHRWCGTARYCKAVGGTEPLPQPKT